MSTEPNLRLVDPEAERGDTILFERRSTTRRRAAQHVTTLLRTEDGDGAVNAIGSLHIFDISETGMGAKSQQRLPVGSEITILFPPHGAEKGFDVYGEVARCEHVGDHYEVGLAIKSQTRTNVA